jgi:phosphatidylglycerophosphate synthase
MTRRDIPNLLTASRLVIAPAMVAVAWGPGSHGWFVGLLVVGLLTDGVDGWLARRLGAQSDLGRRLDSWGDYVLMAAFAAGLWRLWPDFVRAERWWIAAGLAAFYGVVVWGLLRRGRAPGYHTWFCKALAVALPLVMAALLAGAPVVWFHAVVTLQVFACTEEFAIAGLLPEHEGEMPSVWHAWRRRMGK